MTRSMMSGIVLAALSGSVLALVVPAVVHAQPVTVAAHVIGGLDSDVGAALKNEIVPPKGDISHSIIVGRGAWSNDDKAALKEQFQAKRPIALISPSTSEVAALREAIGLEGTPAVPSGASRIDAYAIDRSVDGQQHELLVISAGPLPKATVTSYGGNSTTGTVTSTREEPAPDTVDASVTAAKVGEVVTWLQQDLVRDAAAAIRAARALNASGASTAAGDDKFKDLEDVVTSTESRAVFHFRNNIHALVTNVWSVHNATKNEDWFLVQQKGQFSAANELLPLALVNNISSQEGNDRGRFSDFYSVNTYVRDLLNNDAVWTELSSPATTSGADKVSSSVSWNLSGKLSGNLKATSDGKGEIGGGGEISAGVSVNNSIAFDIPDVTVRNQSGTAQNNAAWEYAINAPAWTNGFGCIGFTGLFPLKQMSAGTFQPVQQWIWRVSPAARTKYPGGLPIEVRFKTRVRHIYYGPGCNWNMTDWKQDSTEYSASLTVPWPQK